MNLVDSSGWLEYLAAGANATFFQPAIQQPDTLVVPTICQYEVFKRLFTQLGEGAALLGVAIMSLGTEIDLTRDIAVSAAVISSEQKLAMADSIILATAEMYGATLWTQDVDFRDVPGVRYIAK
jgi:predicted nucleic acid-binding protein